MRRNRELSVGMALLSLALVAVAAMPVFGQMGGPHGPGGPLGRRGGPEGGMGGFRSRGGPPSHDYRRPGGPPSGDYRRPGGPPSGDDRSRGGPPSGASRGSSSGYRGPFGGSDGLERFERFLRELDTDKDGRVEEHEVDGRRRYFVEMMARRAGVEPKFPFSISKLQKGMAKASQQGSSRSSSSNSRSSDGKRGAEPLVPGFGVALDLSPLLKFGQRAAEDSGGAASSSSRSGSRGSGSSRGSSSRGDSDDKVRRWAEVMMRQSDRNRNGRLEPNEWNNRWGSFRDADRNHDGVVKPDEMARQLGEYSRGRMGMDRSRSDRSSRSDSSSSGRSAPRSDGSDKPKSYRFRTPTERLPEGLPPLFASKDANGDGQVAMAEWESPGYWTAATAAEFSRRDLNNDGIITPREWLAAMDQGGDVAKAGVANQVAQATAASPPSRRRSGRGGPAPAARESTSSSAGATTSGGVWEGF